MPARRHPSLFVALAVLAFTGFSFVLVASVMGASSRLAQGWHGLFFSASIYQIVNGIVPPTNPLSVETASSYFWIWHYLMAQAVRLSGRSP